MFDKVEKALTDALNDLKKQEAGIRAQIAQLESVLGITKAAVKVRVKPRVKTAPVTRGPGRPKGSKNKVVVKAKAKAKPHMSAKSRKQQSARMKTYWANWRKKKTTKVKAKSSKANGKTNGKAKPVKLAKPKASLRTALSARLKSLKDMKTAQASTGPNNQPA